MKLAIPLAVGILASYQSSFASFEGGSTAGNGGSSVVCPNVPGQPPTRLLDFYEMDYYDHTRPQLPNGPEKPEAIAASFLGDLAKHSPLRAEAFQDELREFWSRASINDTLPDIHDIRNIVLPEGCHLEQIVIQHRENGIPSYEVNGPLWRRLSIADQAGTLLHELFYGESLDEGKDTSDDARLLLRTLLRDSAWKAQDYVLANLVRHLGFNRWIEVVMPSGEDVVFRPSDLEEMVEPEFGPWMARQANFMACGAQVATGQWFYRCGRFDPGYSFETRDGRIYSIDDGRVYKIGNQAIGLPFPIQDYTPYSSFLPLTDVRVEDARVHVWCKGGSWVNDEPGDNAPKDRFDLPNGNLESCEVSSSHPERNEVRLFNQWVGISKMSSARYTPERTFEFGGFDLLEPMKLDAFGQSVQINAVDFWFGWMLTRSALTPSVMVLGQRCALGSRGTIGFKFDTSDQQSTLLSYDDNGSCKIRVNGVQVSVDRIAVKPNGDALWISLSEPATLPIHTVDANGREHVDTQLVLSDRILYIYSPGVFRYEDKNNE